MPNFTQDWMRIQDASARRGDAPETIEGLRQQYFATRIAPEIIKRGGDDQTLQLAAQRFDSETKGKFSASQSMLTPEEQELARQDKQGTAGLNAAGDILKSFAGRVANSSADIASGLGSLIPYGGKERDSWSQIPANIIRGGAQRLMDETSQTTKDAYESKAGKAADFVLGSVPYVATMGISKVPAIAGLGTAGKLATGATVGFAGGYGSTAEQARQSLDRISDEDLKRSILDQAAVDQKAPAVQAYIDANGDLRKTRDLLANHAGNVGGSVMAAASPLIGMLGGTAGKVLANRAVGKLVEEGVSEPIARRMVAKSIADEAAKQTIGGVAKRVGTDMLMQGTGMGAAMAGGQYAATGAVADAMGRDRTDEEKAQIAHAGIEGFVGGALAAPFFTAMHKVDSAREQLDADAKAAKSAANEIKAQQNEMLAIARQRSEAQAAGDVNGIASADQSFQQAQQVIAANKEKLRQLNADDEGNLLGRDGNKTLVQQAKSLADVARNALTRSKADAVDQTNTAIQTGIADQAAAIDRARRLEQQYNDTGEIQQPAQNSPRVADTAYGRKQAQGDEAKTPHFDAAAGALSDAGGDLNRAINILRRKSPDLSPNQAAEEVVRAHRIIRNQQNSQETSDAPQQPEPVSKPIDPEQAKRGLIDLAEQGDLHGLRQSAADLANGDENAYNALMDSAFTGAKLRKDAAAKAASDAQKAQATDAAMVEKAKQHIAKSGGDLVDAAIRMRAANKNMTPAQASEYVTRAHMDLNRPAMEQANAQEAASAARPVNGIAGINEQPTGNIIDGTATPIDYGPDVRPSVSTQAAIDRSPARASLPAPTAQDRLPSPDTAGTPSIKPDTVIQVGPEGTAMPRPARTIQEEARQRRDVTVPSGTKAKIERPARADQRSVIGGEQLPGTIQEAAKVIAPAAKAEQAATGMEVEFGGKRYPVESLADASAKWQEYVGRNNLGVSDVGNGVPVYSGGKQIARVSYNGRLWDMQGKEIAPDAPQAAQPKTIQQAASEIKPEVNASAAGTTASAAGSTASAAGKPTTQPKKATTKPVVDPERDNLLVAIAKLGGIDREQAKAQGGFDPAEMNRRAGGLLPIFRKTGGQNLDRMAEMLHERGYPVSENGSYTVNALLDALDHAMRGGDVGTPMYHERKAQAEYEARQQEQDIPFDEPGTNWVDAASDSWMTEAVNNEIKPDAVAASELRSIEDEQRKPSAPGASGQEADTGAKADGGPARAGEAVAGREGGQSEGQGVSRQGTGGQAGELTLESYTDADLAKRAEAIRQQQEAEKRKAESERLKAQADRELSSFTLTGSDRPADVAMAAGQNDLFGPKTRGEKAAKADEVPPQASDFPNAASYHAALADFRKANPPAPRADTEQASSDRRAEIKLELAVLEKQYKQRMNKDSGLVPPSIKSDALNSIARKMSSLDAELKELDAAKSKENPVATIKTEATISDADYAQVVEAAKYLKDIVYSMDNLVGDDTDLLIAMSSDLGKSGRDTILMDAFGIDRSLSHTINNRLDDRKPHKLRAVDMQDVLEQYPGLKRIVDNAKEQVRLRNERKAGKKERITPASAGDMKAGDIIKTADGKEYMAMRARQDFMDAHPVVNGKPVVNNESTVRFHLNPDTASAYPERNHAPVFKAGRNQYEPSAREMTEEGRAKDGKPIMPGDKFKTSSGRETTPYPKQKGEKYASQWLIDNATAEAEARGDDFNAPAFRRTTILKSGGLTDGDRQSLQMYLFGEQPRVVPSILKPLVSERERTIQDHAKEIEGQKKSEPAVVEKGGDESAKPEQSANPSVTPNKVFTEDAAAKAREVLRKALLGNRPSSGIDPEVFQAGITLAGYHIEKGARTFAAYAKAMLDDLGEIARPYLKQWYMGLKYDPRASALDGMSSAAEVDAFDVSQAGKAESSDAKSIEDYVADQIRKNLEERYPDGNAPKVVREVESTDYSIDQILQDHPAVKNRRDDPKAFKAFSEAAKGVDRGAIREQIIGTREIQPFKAWEPAKLEQDNSEAQGDVQYSRGGQKGDSAFYEPSTNQKVVLAEQRPIVLGDEPSGGPAGEGIRGKPEGGARLPVDRAADAGERGDQPVYREDGQYQPEKRLAGDSESGRGRSGGDTGVHAGREGRAAVARIAQQSETDRLNEKRSQQKAAESVPVIPGDRENIDQTLPFLLEGQREDVHKAETRFAAPNGHGMLFTNGTGTGKTFLGLGIAKRFARHGKGNGLIVVPNEEVMNEWVNSAPELNLTITPLADTKDKGRGIAITTYANLGQNDAISHRNYDFVIADEAHNLMQNAAAEDTAALLSLRAITLHDSSVTTRTDMQNRDMVDRMRYLRGSIAGNSKIINNPDTMDYMVDSLRRENETMERELNNLQAQYDQKKSEVAKEIATSPKPKAVFLSATPFAYEKNVRWAQGYLFDWNEGRGDEANTFLGYNEGSNYEQFMMQHFGYRMRYNKLTEPDANVDRDLMQRQFNSTLKKSGALSSRMLDVPSDYQRAFALTPNVIGTKIDEGLTWLREAENGRYRPIYDMVNERFDYLSRQRLLEAMKAEAVIPMIREWHALGKKVVVFYDFNSGGGFSPFDLGPVGTDKVQPGDKSSPMPANEFVAEFYAKRPDLKAINTGSLLDPLTALRKAFPDAGVVNGMENRKNRNAALKDFNDDSKPDANLLMVQSAINAGWSAHDKSGKFKRVLINLGLPTAPTKAIQQEGRIYRQGQHPESDSMFVYLNTGTAWERIAFANTIANRASTAENLAMGESARGLKDAFIMAFEESDHLTPSLEEGKGSKERDRSLVQAISPFDRAKSYYFGVQKNAKSRASREGKDYYATPEPVGLKMVEWLGLRDNERALEPSAGHGAISRWLPDGTKNTIIEPSFDLLSRAALNTNAKQINGDFESLHLTNKFEGIVMNPPFGSGGKTVVEHLDKAFRHLTDGGRIVALIPRGGMADKQFNEWYEGTNEKGKPNNPDAVLRADITLPDVTFERAGTKAATRIVVIDKIGSEEQRAATGYAKRIDLSNAGDIKELFNRIEDLGVPDRVTPKREEPVQSQPQSADKGPLIETAETTHAIKKIPLFVAKLTRRVTADGYRVIDGIAKRFGGYYSKFAKNGAIPGFQFDSAEKRQQFIDALGDQSRFSVADRAEPSITVERARQLIDTDPVLSKASRFIDIKNSTDEIPSGAELLYSPAWHGSPHSFDKFSLDHIGTGEGAQAYGWGLYFAGSKEVAQFYKKALTFPDFDKIDVKDIADALKKRYYDTSWNVADLIDSMGEPSKYDRMNIDDILREWWNDPETYGRVLAIAKDVGADQKSGKLYHVEIPDDGTYLLWDKPLSEQPEAVKKALMDAGIYPDTSADSRDGEWLYKKMVGDVSAGKINVEAGKADESASKYLHSLGISGIKYLDGSSRSKGEGNYNYVVFDDNAVKIIDRYSARKNQAEGYYHNGKVTLFADNIAAFHNQSAEERLKWVAFHELTHRGVAKLAESREYLDALDRAGQNPFIKNLASKIMAARKGSPYEVTRSIATEEALAEVSAALQTGDVSHLKDRYGLNFPESIRTAAKTAMQRFFEVVKRILSKVFGRGLTDQQIGELLGRTMKAGLERGESAGEATSDPASARYSVIDDVKDRISEEAKAMLASDSQLSLLNRTLGTKLNIALRIPAYKAVHDKVRAFLNHTNVEAFEAVNKAPELLARNEDASDYKRELKRLDPRVVLRQEQDIAKTAKVIYENTLRADSENKKVFTDSELRAKGLNDDQIRVYRTFMDAVNVSLDNFAKANITRLMMQAGVIDGDAAVRLHNKELPLNEHLANLREQAGQMAERLQDNINSGDDSAKTARELDVVKAAIDSSNDIADKANRLKSEGYAPAMRFGEHTVTAYDESGRVAYFEGFDSKTAAIRAEKAFKEENPKWRIERGTMSQEKFKQFQGLTPETVALFAKEAGYENDPAYQEYLKLAINNSSPLKRMIHRKGIAGYSQDLPRVLSSFVMSNARGSSRAIFSGQMQDALSALKQAHPHDGKLYDDAAKLVDYVQNPKEEAQFLKNMLFHFYLAGSFGFGLVNLLQPLHMTSAQIARYNGGKALEAFKTVKGSYGRAIQAMRTGKPPQEYAEDFKRAQREGYLDPANTYALQGIERGRSGYAHTWLGAASHALSSIARITETINRTSTFIAAMDFAKATGEASLRKAGFKDAYDFATRAIDETQGVYDKSNRPNAARGAIGSLLMAYKMYPINFIEFGARMAKEGLKGNPAGYTGLAMLLGVLAVTSGVTGLPLAQDLIDALEGIFAGFGHPFNADRFMREHMKPEAADVLMHGIGAVPGAPLDLASRMSMGSQVPGLPQLINPTLSDDESRRAGQQLGGAAENLLLNFYDAYKLAFGQGKYGEAVIQASPKWAKSVAKSFEMATKGEYTDSKGRKVRDVTALDAIVKALDIQPASISRQQRIRGIEMQDLSIQKNKEKYFADRMFDAAMSNDSTAMLQAQADLEKWNRDNPLYQVNIDYQRQVGRRVIEARKGPAQRLKTPKEMRWIQGEAMDASQ